MSVLMSLPNNFSTQEHIWTNSNGQTELSFQRLHAEAHSWETHTESDFISSLLKELLGPPKWLLHPKNCSYRKQARRWRGQTTFIWRWYNARVVSTTALVEMVSPFALQGNFALCLMSGSWKNEKQNDPQKNSLCAFWLSCLYLSRSYPTTLMPWFTHLI